MFQSPAAADAGRRGAERQRPIKGRPAELCVSGRPPPSHTRQPANPTFGQPAARLLVRGGAAEPGCAAAAAEGALPAGERRAAAAAGNGRPPAAVPGTAGAAAEGPLPPSDAAHLPGHAALLPLQPRRVGIPSGLLRTININSNDL